MKNIIIFLSIIIIPIILGILISKITSLHYVDSKYLLLGIFSFICSIIAIFKTEKFVKNIKNKIEVKMIKIFWIIFLPLSLFLIINSLEELKLEEINCNNLLFESSWKHRSIIEYSCDWAYYFSHIWNIRTNCNYNLFIKKDTNSIYSYKLINCN